MPPFAIGLVLISTFLHAGWNLMVRDQRSTTVFRRVLSTIALVGLLPTLAFEFVGTPILPLVWLYLVGAGLFQGIYFFGLTMGYHTGDFTIVYPLARALPVLLVAFADVFRKSAPSALGWVGIVWVAIGCIAVPLPSLSGFDRSHYLNRAMLWTLVTALGTVGYTIVDSAAAQRTPPGLTSALSYGVYEWLSSLIWFSIILGLSRLPVTAHKQISWRRSVFVALLMFSAYVLVLWAYQLSAHSSYVVALRQFSIVIGVVIGGLYFHEPARRLRLVAAAIIVLGGVCIALAR